MRRIAAQLRRENADWAHLGRGRVRRLLRQLDLLRRPRSARRRTTDSEHPWPRFPNLVRDWVVTHPRHVWVADITYIKLGDGSFVYLTILMDVFTRVICSWALSRSLGGELSLAALRRARQSGTPDIHHSDQGKQYAAAEYVALLTSHGVPISMAEVGHGEQNGYAETGHPDHQRGSGGSQ